MNNFKIVVCASGGGGNFKALIDAQKSVGYTIAKLIVNKDCGAIKVAEEHKIPWQCIKSKENVNFTNDFVEAIPEDIELIVLAGYMPILPDVVCEKFNHKIINTHPSLLPKYGGKGMFGVKVQEAVMAAHESKAGCTVHYVTKDIDAGEIILQKEIEVNYSETPWQLGGRVFEEEIKLLPQAIKVIKENPQPLVSICCLVYNHEPFLRECFDGFVMQKTTFPIEILVHDDASTDHSADIIREYTAKYPDLFNPIYQTENQYSKGVKITATYQIPRARGKYIAMCEGDDYWTDPLKLQKQVEFMEKNEGCSLCCTGYNVFLHEENLFRDQFSNSINGFFDKEDYIKNEWFIQTATVVFRKNHYADLDCYKYKKFRDYHLYYFLLQKGFGYMFKDKMSVYRMSNTGINAKKPESFLRKQDYELVKDVFLNNPDDLLLKFALNERLKKYHHYVCIHLVEEKMIKEVLYLYKECKWINGLGTALKMIKDIIRPHMKDYINKRIRLKIFL